MEDRIRRNLEETERRIALACERSGRARDGVTLVAVSKTKPAETVRAAYDCGVRDFGENKVKELLEKRQLLPQEIRWHMIGHLQTNKVRSLIGKTCLIHSVDSVKLADCIDAESARARVVTDALMEVNVAMEPTKHGFLPEADPDILERFSRYRNLRILGLMTVAPDVADPEENREIFRRLRALAVDMESKNIDNITMKYLSMGMTGDYEVAVEEGAGFVRIGTGIFGQRERMEM